MTIKELAQIVKDYAAQYNCSIEQSINDLEFDGPSGSFGPDAQTVEELHDHFAQTDRFATAQDMNTDAAGWWALVEDWGQQPRIDNDGLYIYADDGSKAYIELPAVTS